MPSHLRAWACRNLLTGSRAHRCSTFVQNDTTYAIDRSAWVITAFDSAPIADALPDMLLVPTKTHPA